MSINKVLTNVEQHLSEEEKAIARNNIDAASNNIMSNIEYIFLDLTNGDDDNDGLTYATPVKTIEVALSKYKSEIRSSYSAYIYLKGNSPSIRLPSSDDTGVNEITFMSEDGNLEVRNYNLDNNEEPIDIINPKCSINSVAKYNINVKTSGTWTGSLNLKCGGYLNLTGPGGNVSSGAIPNGNINAYAKNGIVVSGPGYDQNNTSDIILETDGSFIIYSFTGGNVSLIQNGTMNGASSGPIYAQKLYIKSPYFRFDAPLYVRDSIRIESNDNPFVSSGRNLILFSGIDQGPWTGYHPDVSINWDGEVQLYAYVKVNSWNETSRRHSGNSGGFTSQNDVIINTKDLTYVMNGGISIGGTLSVNIDGDLLNMSLNPTSSVIYVNNIIVNVTGSHDRVFYHSSIYPKLTNPFESYDSTNNPYVIDRSSNYIFNLKGNLKYYDYASSIQNPLATVIINSDGEVYLSQNGCMVIAEAIINCKTLKITNGGFVASRFDITCDEYEMIGSNYAAAIIHAIPTIQFSGNNYTPYNSYSEITSHFSANIVKCSLTDTSDLLYIFKYTYTSNYKSNLDVNIGMIITPYVSPNRIYVSGPMSPQLITYENIDSISQTFNSKITGKVGPYINNSGKVSEWYHDVHSNFFYPSTYGAITGTIEVEWTTPKLMHFYIDPDQGDDALDGLSYKTGVKTTQRLMDVIRSKTNNYVSGSYYKYLNVIDCVTIHVLSGRNYNNRGDGQMCGSEYEFNDLSNRSNWTLDFTALSFDSIFCYYVQFQLLEILPEAPDLTINIKGCKSSVLYIHDFYAVGLYGFNAYQSEISALMEVCVNNSYSSGDFNLYNTRLGPCTLRAKNVLALGWFNCLCGDATNNLIIKDSYGGSSDTDGNCCLSGITKLTAAWISLGVSDSEIGITGTAFITAAANLNCYMDSFTNAVAYINIGGSFYGHIGSSFFKGVLNLECNDFYMDSSDSFDAYNACANYGGGGIVSIKARNQIIWPPNSPLYGIDLLLDTPKLVGNSIYSYGYNGQGKLEINARELYTFIYVYYLNHVFIHSDHYTSPFYLMSGGPFGPSSGDVPTCYVNLDVGKMRSSIYLYSSTMAKINWEITTRYGLVNTPILNWNNGQSIDPSNPPTFNDTYKFSITAGSSTYDYGDKYGYIPQDPVATGTIQILDDKEPKIIEVPVEIESGIASVELQLGKYNVITGLDSTVTDLEISVPVNSNNALLTELGFEFYLDAFSNGLNSVTFVNSEVEFAMIIPQSFTAEHLYQGTLVHRCITLAEYDKEDTNVVEINGKKYRTVKIGEQTWMAENLADPNSGVWYDNDQATYEPLGYGKLYTYNEALVIANSVPGWHLPTYGDTEALQSAVNSIDPGNDAVLLKSTTGWNNDGNGINALGFDWKSSGMAYPSPGGGSLTFVSIGARNPMLTTTETFLGPNTLYTFDASYDQTYTSHGTGSIELSCSVRLVKDMSINIGGRDYKVVQIGNQLWMAENLDWKFTGLTFRDGTTGNEVTDDATIAQGAYFNYDESTYGELGNKYGMLYNWTAADYINQHLSELGIPNGWHIPDNSEWNTLINSVGRSDGGTKLKSTSGWNGSSGNGIDYYGFNAVPVGRWDTSSFNNQGYGQTIWSATPMSGTSSKCIMDINTQANLTYPEEVGDGPSWLLSIRLVRNLT